ncbi:XRE family transcriptional regulator, partial [bacterium]|nr:XRE family transcriptional regulator [bacterium]
MNYNKIGNFIAEKRKEKGLTQKELAEKIGVTDKAVSKWERGLGCPDVSILEVLASTLDVSILEILKGRTIENEIIKVTEANDYVKESLNYSKVQTKEKLKIILSKLICFFIILIGTILIILNIFHYFYLNYQYDNIFNSTIFQSDIEKIEKNIKIIKNHQGIYNDEDY